MKRKLLTLSTLFLFLLTTNVKSQSQLWGVTYSGGSSLQGAIIHANSNGTGLTVAHNFHAPAGYHPYGNLLHATDGNLYGTCYDGGQYASCTIYRFEPSTGIYTDVVSFNITQGDFPRSGVIEGSNSKLYGAASAGGATSGGVLYSYDLNTGIYSDLFNLSISTGSRPNGNPILHSNGKLYGMTSYGGVNFNGVIYSFDISTNTYSDIYDFDSLNGSNYGGSGSLLELGNGKLYGMTNVGGVNNKGVIFSFDPVTNVYLKLFDFSNADGTFPHGSLIQASNGLLYGMTRTGGVNTAGVIFSYNVTTNLFTNLYSFIAANGGEPEGSLMQSGNILCGTTSFGGTANLGVMFNFDITTNTYTKVVDFTGTNGATPYGGFISVTPTGIAQNNMDNKNISVFPSPAHDKITVTMPSSKSEMATFILRNITDNAVYSSSEMMTSDFSKTIDLSKISAGTYFLEITTEKEKVVKKVVKQ